jgi:type VI secretion system VgrG family protein
MINLRFESRALPADTFQVLQFDGEEEISKLYHFELLLVSRDPDIDFEAVLESSAQLAITAQGNTRYLNGMISRFDQGGQWQNGLYEYRAVLVPRLWIMAQSTQNQIFQEQTVPDIVESELSSISKKGSHPLVRDGLSVDDYEIYTIRDYDEREYVVQYKETDHNFISRLMEHEGIYYYFEQDDIREKLVVTDAMATEEITGDSYAVFQSEASATHYDSNVVYKLTRSQQQIPDSVLVKDFNYRSPSMPMQSDSQVGENGIGFVTEFGAHFKEPEQGQVLATLRAEEYRCRQNIYTGESNIAAMTCAGVYSLGQHFRREYNQSYMITRVRHSGSQEIESWGNVGSTRYNNEFDCIPSGMPYRPQRLAPKPKLYGIMNGTIDSELDTGRADIDELGRYKVMMPFDISGVAPGMGSRRIRMAQPYGGGGSGMSFPLIKGTEVIWTCIDGDIDRPIITGAVPNPLNPSVTTHENNTSNVIKTSSGITMGFHDGAGSGVGQNAAGGGAGGGLSQQQAYQKSDNIISACDEYESISAATSNKKDQAIEQQQQQGTASAPYNVLTDYKIDLTSPNVSTEADNSTGKRFMIEVPNYKDDKDKLDSYLRLGKTNPWEVSGITIESTDGWFDYTDGNHLSITHGKRTDVITGGDHTIEITDPTTKNPMSLKTTTNLGNSWRTYTLDHTSSTGFSFGDSETVFAGYKFIGTVGLSTGVTIGGSLSFAAAAEYSYKAAISRSHTIGAVKTTSSAKTIKGAPDIETTAYKRLEINIKPPIENPVGHAAAIAGACTAVTGAVAAGVLIGHGGATDNWEGGLAEAGLALGAGASAAMLAAMTAKTLAELAAQELAPAITQLSMTALNMRLGMGEMRPAPGIDITPEGVTIGCGATTIVLNPAGVTITAPKIDLISTAKIGIKSGGMLSLDSVAACDIKAGGNISLTTPHLDGTKCVTVSDA